MDVVIVFWAVLLLMLFAAICGLLIWEWYLEIRTKYAHKAKEESK